MQDRYTGDIGDYVKYGLLRALVEDYTLGVAWYLFPDEGHNEDGRHIAYLNSPEPWRHRDPKLFDGLRRIVVGGQRKVLSIESSGLLGGAKFASQPLSFDGVSVADRRELRQRWFSSVLEKLSGCGVVFADPDNGLCEDSRFSYSRIKDWKRLPLCEALALAQGRTGIFYHHNSRRKGGHLGEIEYWIGQLGKGTLALRWRAFSNRTFFIVNPSPIIAERLKTFVKAWSPEALLLT